ncbi:hypothetical protein V5O48_006427 [Marasmius crinis-equi]|uniref:F-box domain-containing protein n=1 Tax=Marasmius crinis-equi TaxID=585013 RepID=A0ABR3FKF9_9AGAR
MLSRPTLPYDILECVINDLDDDDLSTMAMCCRLSHDINKPASSKLYSRLGVDLVGSKGTIERVSSMLHAASLPRNCRRVKTVILRAKNPLNDQIYLEQRLFECAFQEFSCLENLTINIEGYMHSYTDNLVREGAIDSVLGLASKMASLRSLVFNPPLPGPVGNVLALFHHTPLRELCLIGCWDNPLQNTPVEFSQSLTRLQIRANQVVENFIVLPELRVPTLPSVGNLRNLKSLTIGFGDTNKSHEMLESLALLPRLESLCLEFTNDGLNAFHSRRDRPLFPRETGLATSFSPLRNLKSFTVRHKDIDVRETMIDVPRLCRWIKHIISLSSIEELSFERPFYPARTQNPNPKQSWDILVDNLADKHAKSLRYLDLRAGFVRKTAMEILLRKCNRLEELAVATSPGSLVTLIRNASAVPRLLRAHFEFRTHKRARSPLRLGRSFNLREATDIMKAARLRRLTINDDEWLGSWVRDGDDALEYRVEAVATGSSGWEKSSS